MVSFFQSQLACHSPEKLYGRKWKTLDDQDLACLPFIDVDRDKIELSVGSNASLLCTAGGDPLPKLTWVYNGHVLTNNTLIWYSNPERTYLVLNGIYHEKVWSNLIIRDISEDDLNSYNCVAENNAGLVDRNVTLVLKQPGAGGGVVDYNTTIIIAAAVAAAILVLLLSVLVCYCCWRRKHTKRRGGKHPLKQNGSVGHHMDHKNILIVNPVEKPPRQYEKIPQTDVEMNTLAAPGSGGAGSHQYDGGGDYAHQEIATHYHPARLPLATLEEEIDDQEMPGDVTLPLHSSVDQSGHFPDLLDNARIPRAISPTQLSYHSLVYPCYTSPNTAEWRYSYILPGENTHYPMGYTSTPQHQPSYRPGYVTLPRRPRVPSWSGAPSLNLEEEGEEQGGKVPAIYDRLGPRTTADGTSRTDLHKTSITGASVNDSFIHSPTSPLSPHNTTLPLHYTPISEAYPVSSRPSKQPLSATLPRSTPNLLEERGFTLPKSNPPPTVTAVVHKPSSRAEAVSPTPSTSSTVRLASPAQPSPSPGSSSEGGNNTASHLQLNTTGHLNISNHSDSNRSSPLVPQITSNNNNNTINSSNKKKVPPKPPPKPSKAKRLSVTSPSSDSGTRKVSVDGGRIYQDEGPDGTEV